MFFVKTRITSVLDCQGASSSKGLNPNVPIYSIYPRGGAPVLFVFVFVKVEINSPLLFFYQSKSEPHEGSDLIFPPSPFFSHTQTKPRF